MCSSLKHGRYQCPHRDEVPSMPKSGSEKSAENQKGKGKGKGGDKSASKGAGKSHSAVEQQSGGSENAQAKVNKVSTESTHGGAIVKLNVKSLHRRPVLRQVQMELDSQVMCSR